MNYDEPIAYLRVNRLGKHTTMSAQELEGKPEQELWKDFVPLYCPAQIEIMIDKIYETNMKYDSIDASVFSGDLFMDKLNREDLRNWMARWEIQLKEYEAIELSELHSKFKIGDKVKVYRKYEDEDTVFWAAGMDCYVGQEFIICGVDLEDNSVEFEETEWWFPMQSLVNISQENSI